MGTFPDIAQRIHAYMETHHEEMVALLRRVVAIPSFDSQIGEIGRVVGERMGDLGFDEVRFDAMGNILGRIGDGPRIMVYDSHLDTVGVSDPSAWAWDPFEGKVEDGILYGLGAGDEKGSTPPMLYALAALKTLGLAREWTFYYFGNMEEWCDGIAPQALVEHEGIRPDFVVIGEPTGLQIYRGHRGRLEVEVIFKGRTCHASAPDLGLNAVYRAVPFIEGVEQLNGRLRRDPFLGAGTIAVTDVRTKSPSLNAVPDECRLYLDRRLLVGEGKEQVMAELRALPHGNEATMVIPDYREPSYTGFIFPMEKYFPAWVLPEDHLLVQAARETTRLVFGREAIIGKWAFSTNGTYWMGKAGIPSIGFGPGDERYAHTVLDQVPIAEVLASAEFYAMFPLVLEASLARI